MTELSRFDQRIDRLASESSKWHTFDPDVVPMGVADMDFLAPDPVIDMLRQRVDHGVFGYAKEPPELRSVIVERLQRLYDWDVSPKSLLFVPGVVPAANVACQALTEPGDGILVQVPTYGNLLRCPEHARCELQVAPVVADDEGYSRMDWERTESAIDASTRLFLLCSPHNPTGRVYRRQEVERMAEMVLRHDLFICSDEIHCDLVYPEFKHTPIASLSPDVAARTITLMAPSKTFNIAGLKTSVAIIPDKELRTRFEAGRRGILGSVSIMGHMAALAAYREGDGWLQEALAYLRANRDLVHETVQSSMPGIRMSKPEGTYLAWLDCREAAFEGNPFKFFLKHARVGLTPSWVFDPECRRHVRLNFGCPRAQLQEALDRMVAALA